MKKILLILFVNLILLISCKDNNNPTSPDNGNIILPNSIGSSWEFVITDTIYYLNFIDSIVINNGIEKVSIIKSKLISNNKRALLYQYEFNGKVTDTLFAVTSNDTIFFYNDEECNTINMIFVFPLEVNKKWQFDYCNKYKVVSKETLDLPFGRIHNNYCIEHEFICEGEAGLLNKYYINTSIGIVKEEIKYSNVHYGILQNRNSVLKSYFKSN